MPKLNRTSLAASVIEASTASKPQRHLKTVDLSKPDIKPGQATWHVDVVDVTVRLERIMTFKEFLNNPAKDEIMASLNMGTGALKAKARSNGAYSLLVRAQVAANEAIKRRSEHSDAIETILNQLKSIGATPGVPSKHILQPLVSKLRSLDVEILDEVQVRAPPDSLMKDLPRVIQLEEYKDYVEGVNRINRQRRAAVLAARRELTGASET